MWITNYTHNMSFSKQITERLILDLEAKTNEKFDLEFMGASLNSNGDMVATAKYGEDTYEVTYEQKDSGNFQVTDFNLLSKTEETVEDDAKSDAAESESPDGGDKEEIVDDEAKTDTVDEVDESESVEEAKEAEQSATDATKDCTECGSTGANNKSELETFKGEVKVMIESAKQEILSAVDEKLSQKSFVEEEDTYLGNAIVSEIIKARNNQ